MATGIYVLTKIGDNYASNPSRGEPSDTLKVLYHARRHGGRITAEQVESIVGDKWQAQKVLRDLVDMKAAQKIV